MLFYKVDPKFVEVTKFDWLKQKDKKNWIYLKTDVARTFGVINIFFMSSFNKTFFLRRWDTGQIS